MVWLINILKGSHSLFLLKKKVTVENGPCEFQEMDFNKSIFITTHDLHEYKMKYFIIFLIILTFSHQNRMPGFFIQVFHYPH